MEEADLRTTIQMALRSLNDTAEQAIRKELATRFDLGHSGRLQFEIDPWTYRITLTQTENDVIPGYVVLDALPSGLEETMGSAGLDVYRVLSAETIVWFAERWQAVGGPGLFRPAYAFFHGGLEQPRYDLEQRRWFAITEIWPHDA
jgi:hypothetical protein